MKHAGNVSFREYEMEFKPGPTKQYRSEKQTNIGYEWSWVFSSSLIYITYAYMYLWRTSSLWNIWNRSKFNPKQRTP